MKTIEKIDERDERLVYYGPHPCQRCDPTGKNGTMIVKAGPGTSKKINNIVEKFEFDFVHGSHYPNHAWKKHKCYRYYKINE